MTAYKCVEHIFATHITSLQSHLLSIFFSTLFCTAIASYILRLSKGWQAKILCEQAERLGIEKVLRESEERYRELFENANDIVYTVDFEGNFTSLNKAGERIFGYTQDEALSMKIDSVIAPEYLALTKQMIQRKLAGESASLYEIDALTKDNRRISLEVSTRIIRRDDRLIGIQGISRDITKRKQVEEELRSSEEQYRFLTETIPQHIWTAQPDGNLNYGNLRTVLYFGKKNTTEFLGMEWLSVVHPDDQLQCIERWTRAVQTGAPYETEFRLRRHDGEYRWHLAQAVPMRDSDQKIIQWFGTNTDIHDRKAAEHEFRKSQQMMQLIIDAIPYSVFWKDQDSIYLGCNKHFAQNRGFKDASDVVGKTDYDLAWSKDNADLYREFDRRVIESGVPEILMFESNQPGTNMRLTFEVNKIPLRDSQGNIIGILSTSENVTNRVHAEKERKQLEEQLRQAQKLESVGQLAAGVAHEINTPLQYVGDNACFLKESFQDLLLVIEKYHELFEASCTEAITFKQVNELDELIKERDVEFLVSEIPTAIEQSLEGIERVTGIVQAMKDFAHPGTIEMKAVNLNKSIESTITISRNEWKYVAEMETDFAPDLPHIYCTISEINQVILNMIVNAAHTIADVVGDGSNGKGQIKITTRRDKDAVEIRISDTGKGIPVEARSKIFDLFFTTKEVGKGTGQGLAISHQVIVVKHGGSLTFETEIDKGTTFIICLPIKQINKCEEQFAEELILN